MAKRSDFRQSECLLKNTKLGDIFDYDSHGNIYEYGDYFAGLDTAPNLYAVINGILGMTPAEFQVSYLARSTEKYISPEFVHLVIEYDGAVSRDSTNLHIVDAVNSLISRVEQRFGDSLLKMAQAYFESEYNPIENYAMTEIETPNITESTSGSSNSKAYSDAHTKASVYGFNSSEAVPASESDADTTTESLKANNFTEGERKTTGNRTLTRTGNIGVTTSQQMLTSELELRKFDMLNEVLKCFDKVFVRSVYGR